MAEATVNGAPPGLAKAPSSSAGGANGAAASVEGEGPAAPAPAPAPPAAPAGDKAKKGAKRGPKPKGTAAAALPSSIGATAAVPYEQATPSGKKYYGVAFMYKVARWRATLYVRAGKTKHLGLYKNALDAAKAYDAAARSEFGSNYAQVNFDKEGRQTSLVHFAYGGLNGEHQTHGAPELDTSWPREGDDFQVDMAKVPKRGEAAAAKSGGLGTWHPHPIRTDDDEENAAPVDTHYGSLHPDPLSKELARDLNKSWKPKEKAEFERAMNELDKDFHLISKRIGTKSYRECVRYYYCVWKMMRACQKWKKGRDELMIKFQQEEQKRATEIQRSSTPGRGRSDTHGGAGHGAGDNGGGEHTGRKGGAGGQNGRKSGSGRKSKQAEAAEVERYCICRGPGVGMMVSCEKCEGWFHGACVGLGIDQGTLKDDDEFECGNCTENGFPSFKTGGMVKSLANEVTFIWDSKAKQALAKEKCPKVRDLVRFLQAHPDYRPYYGDSDEDEEELDGADHGTSRESPGDEEDEDGAKGNGKRAAGPKYELLYKCPPYVRKEAKGKKKARAAARIAKLCRSAGQWLEYESESSDDAEESSEEDSSGDSDGSSEDDEEDDEDMEEDDDSDVDSDGNEYARAMALHGGIDEELYQEFSAASGSRGDFLNPDRLDNGLGDGRELPPSFPAADGSSVFSGRFLPSAMMERGAMENGAAPSSKKRKRGSGEPVPIVPHGTLPTGAYPWMRMAPWNGRRMGQKNSKVAKALRSETSQRIKTLIERIQAHRTAMAVASGPLLQRRKRMERLHGKPRLKRLKTGSDNARVFTPKQFQTLMWQTWVTNNFIKKKVAPPPYAMHEAAGAGGQFRWSGLRCRSIGLIDGAIVAASPRHFEVYKSQIGDLPLNSFNMPPCDVRELYKK